MFLSPSKVIISIPFQWSSSHEDRTKVIQKGLLNPSADILEAMAETEAAGTGRIPYLFQYVFKSLIPLARLHTFSTLSYKFLFF